MAGTRYRKRSLAEAKAICARDRPRIVELDHQACYRIEKPWPDLTPYDFIVFNTSGGKDSAASGVTLQLMAKHYGVQDRLLGLHCDLGRVEWPGAPAAAKRQCKALGIPFYVRSLIGTHLTGRFRAPNTRPVYYERERVGDLLDWVWHRHLQLKARGDGKKISPWPDGRNRYCTSEYKRRVAKNFYIELAEEWYRRNPRARRRCRILDVVGIRCEESDTRCSVDSFRSPRSDDWQTKDYWIDSWFPPFCLDTDEVWKVIRKSRIPVHRAYSWGMPRLSCCLCFFGNCDAHLIAGNRNPKLLKAYADMECKTGWQFRPTRYSANDLVTLLRGGVKPPKKAAMYLGNC
jgi:3'-phosphoadenosine 5'-phosphosulfate sulfotransferase (PAPS reductase)/FAD synthetase